MEYLYYPGCTLKTKAKALEEPVLASLEKLGVTLKELDEWYCCGASFSLVDDNKIRLVAPVRTLLSAKNEGGDRLVTTCTFCYNTLKRANHVMRTDPDKRKIVNDFIEDEYNGEVEVLHLLEVIRDDVGFDGLGERIGVDHSSLKVAAHYGCYLLRPAKELQFDDPYSPTIFENYLRGLGAQVVDFPQKIDCCGAFLVVSAEDDVKESSYKVLDGAGQRGADVMVTSCPLCHYNFSKYQDRMQSEHSDFKKLEILYFTELLDNNALKEGDTQ
jgi:heterodisulfide reductase subunit B